MVSPQRVPPWFQCSIKLQEYINNMRLSPIKVFTNSTCVKWNSKMHYIFSMWGLGLPSVEPILERSGVLDSIICHRFDSKRGRLNRCRRLHGRFGVLGSWICYRLDINGRRLNGCRRWLYGGRRGINSMRGQLHPWSCWFYIWPVVLLHIRVILSVILSFRGTSPVSPRHHLPALLYNKI